MTRKLVFRLDQGTKTIQEQQRLGWAGATSNTRQTDQGMLDGPERSRTSRTKSTNQDRRECRLISAADRTKCRANQGKTRRAVKAVLGFTRQSHANSGHVRRADVKQYPILMTCIPNSASCNSASVATGPYHILVPDWGVVRHIIPLLMRARLWASSKTWVGVEACQGGAW